MIFNLRPHTGRPSNDEGKSTTKRLALAGSVAGLAVVALSACGPAAAAGSGDGGAKDAAANAAGAGNHSAAQASSSRCQSGDLSVTSKPTEGGRMGHAVSRLTFTNASGSTCWVYGYPGVSYVAGDNGQQIGGSAIRGGRYAPSKIWLSPGEAAHADLDQASPYNYPEKDCSPYPVRGLRVYPPDETAAKYVKDPGHACANTHTGRPTITALTQTTN